MDGQFFFRDRIRGTIRLFISLEQRLPDLPDRLYVVVEDRDQRGRLAVVRRDEMKRVHTATSLE